MALNGFVSMINALAWPIATVGLALLFRRDVKSMIARIGHLKYRDVEVTFRDDLQKAEALARSIPSPPRVVLEAESGSSAPKLGGEIIGGHKPASPIQGELDRLASLSPREAVLEAWSIVGQALIKASSKLGDRRAPAPIRAEDASRYLIDRGWLAGPEAQLVDRLRALRDKVAHTEEIAPSVDEARRFVELSLSLVSRIETLG
jgi:hypothetical protein